MLHALELENFKAFGKRARIPFAPITLIFGENSAGKSSILHALYLLKQTIESRESGALLLPRTENGIVDLGSFQEMLFDHDLDRTLSIRVETRAHRELTMEFRFKHPSKEEVLLDQIGIYDGKSSECIAKFQPLSTTEEPKEFWERMGYSPDLTLHDLSLPSTVVECVWLTKATEYWKPEFEWCKKNKDNILDQIKEMQVYFERSLNRRTYLTKDVLHKDLSLLNSHFDLFSSDFDLKTYILERHKEKINAALWMQGFLPDSIMSIKRSRWIKRSPSLLRDQSNDAEICDVAELALESSRVLEHTLRDLFPMGPLRKSPERVNIFRGTSPGNVGYRGDLLPDMLFRRPELVKEANEWLQQLDMGYELDVKTVGTDSGDLFEVRLIDTRRKEPVNVALPDVGFGISQLLPLVVQSLVSEKRIISIEQPEVHVHPKLQADLGNLLAHAIKEPRNNQFIVETHSEHLILRLQRLVREKQIEPEDISVVYISRGPEGAKAERLHLDEDGDFIDDWPNGFFPERLWELR